MGACVFAACNTTLSLLMYHFVYVFRLLISQFNKHILHTCHYSASCWRKEMVWRKIFVLEEWEMLIGRRDLHLKRGRTELHGVQTVNQMMFYVLSWSQRTLSPYGGLFTVTCNILYPLPDFHPVSPSAQQNFICK